MSHDGCMALPCGTLGLFVSMVFPDHTHLLFLKYFLSTALLVIVSDGAVKLLKQL